MSGSHTIGSLSVSMKCTSCKAPIRLAPDNPSLVEIPIKDLPPYNRDLDADYLPTHATSRTASPRLTRCFRHPKHNSGLPGCLKMPSTGKPPNGTNSFAHNPLAVISA